MPERVPTIVLRIGGEAGEGTLTTGDIVTYAAAQAGFEVFTYRTFPAEIRGGQVLFQLRMGLCRIYAEGDQADVLVAMNQPAWDENHANLRPHAALIYDPKLVKVPESYDGPTYAIPAAEIAQGLEWLRGKNLVMVGALSWLLRLGLEQAERAMQRHLSSHQEAMAKNLETLRQGYAYAQEHYPEPVDFALPLPEAAEERLILNGCDAIALGALSAGCRFFGGYPITPATPIMETLAKYLPAFGGTLVQAEDEIASINMVIGASFAGQRAMTATSGPGFSLMVEALGLASMTEVPIVVVNVQRGGPSTGLPTKTGQGDLYLAMYGSHDEAPRIVLAPDSVKDSYYQMLNAFSLAEHFQLPVIVLTDQTMAVRVETMPAPREFWNECPLRRLPTPEELVDYQRYTDTPSGVSPMALPGMAGGIYIAESLEHNEHAHPNYTPEMHERMMAKRRRKIETARAMMENWRTAARRWGKEGATFGVMGWGSTRGAVREALQWLEQEGIQVEALYPHSLLPMPDKAISAFLYGKRAVLIPELNYSNQFARIMEHRYYQQIRDEQIHLHHFPKAQGIPFTVNEIYQAIKVMIAEEGGPA